jgi:polyphosphate kinase
VDGIVRRQSAVVSDHLLPALARQGMAVVDLPTLDGPDRTMLHELFDRSIFPTLTPLAVDHGHPFPYISTLSLNLVVRVRHARAGGTRLARVKVPPLLPRFVHLPDGVRVVPVEQVIAAHVGALFPSMAILETHAFRVTRTALHPLPADRAGSRQAPAEHQLHRRHFGPVVRLEVAATVTPDLLATVATGVGVPGSGVFEVAGLLDPGALARLVPTERPDGSSERIGDSLRRITARPTWPPPLGQWPSTALRGLGRHLLRWIP